MSIGRLDSIGPGADGRIYEEGCTLDSVVAVDSPPTFDRDLAVHVNLVDTVLLTCSCPRELHGQWRGLLVRVAHRL